jgi:hypothetical protein
MHFPKLGLLVVTGLTFATPACFTIKAGDDDSSGGSSGKGGSGGKGGTTSSGGSAGTSGGTTSSGGSSGSSGSGGTTSGGGSSGSSGSGGTTTGALSCKKSDLALSYSCPSGDLNAFTDAVCKPYFACSFASICSGANLNCQDCATFVQGYVTMDEICWGADQKSYVESMCSSSLQTAQSDGYDQCP